MLSECGQPWGQGPGGCPLLEEVRTWASVLHPCLLQLQPVFAAGLVSMSHVYSLQGESPHGMWSGLVKGHFLEFDGRALLFWLPC